MVSSSFEWTQNADDRSYSTNSHHAPQRSRSWLGHPGSACFPIYTIDRQSAAFRSIFIRPKLPSTATYIGYHSLLRLRSSSLRKHHVFQHVPSSSTLAADLWGEQANLRGTFTSRGGLSLSEGSRSESSSSQQQYQQLFFFACSSTQR